jgi:hypothetical protein
LNKIIIGYTGKYIKFLHIDDNRAISFVDQQEYVDAGVFFQEPKINHKRINELSSIILTVFKKNSIVPNTVNIVLDSKLAYINIIPVDFTDEIENINSSLIWELSNFFPDTYKNFKISYQKITANKDEYHCLGNTLLIAYHKNISEITRRLSELSGIKFSNINFDCFTAGRFFIAKGEKDFITLGIKQDRTDICFYLNGEIRNYSCFFEGNINSHLSDVGKSLELNVFSDAKKVFVYGEEDASGICDKLRNINKEISISDPFGYYSNNNIHSDLSALTPHSFTSLFGLV